MTQIVRKIIAFHVRQSDIGNVDLKEVLLSERVLISKRQHAVYKSCRNDRSDQNDRIKLSSC
jgi:hypothetical protein